MTRSGICKSDPNFAALHGVMKRKTTSDVGMNGMLTALARSTLGDDDNERTNAAKLLGSSDATLFAEAITELSTAVSPEESTSTSDVTLTVKPANIRIIKRHTSNIDRHETRRMRRLQWPGRL
uniref:Uncharacterized protein n=1 Tax=Parascaris univalens TaxID=6257 RepID=A0A915B9A6_PARUN